MQSIVLVKVILVLFTYMNLFLLYLLLDDFKCFFMTPLAPQTQTQKGSYSGTTIFVSMSIFVMNCPCRLANYWGKIFCKSCLLFIFQHVLVMCAGNRSLLFCKQIRDSVQLQNLKPKYYINKHESNLQTKKIIIKELFQQLIHFLRKSIHHSLQAAPSRK